MIVYANGGSATESGIMDQRPKDKALEGHLATTMAGCYEMALDQRERTEETNARRVSA